MANFFFICWVYLIAITSHLYIKQSKKKKKRRRLSAWNEVFPETQFMSKWLSCVAPTLSSTSIQTGYPVFTQ